MKYRMSYITFFALLAVSLFVFFSCQMEEPVSKEDRMDIFLEDLNEDLDRDEIYKNLHPDIRNAWKDPSSWSTTALRSDYEPFSFGSLSYGDTTVAGTITSDFHSGDPLEVQIKKDGDDWFIKKVIINSGDVIY